MRSRNPRPVLALAAAAAAVLAVLPVSGSARADDAAPGVPTAVDLDVRSGGSPAFTLTWGDPASGPAPTSYQVLVDGALRTTVPATTHAATVDGLALGSTYKVTVRSVAGSARSAGVGQKRVLTFGAATPLLAANPTNPLAGREWGVYLGRAEAAYDPWLKSTGATHDAISQIMLQPKATWFTHWSNDNDAQRRAGDYFAGSIQGDREVLSQFSLYRLTPWNADTHKRKPTAAERAGYQTYVRGVARAINDLPVAVVLQPDGAWLQGAPRGPGSLFRLMSWTVSTLEALPRTTVYIEIGSADWLRNDTARALNLLRSTGIAKARGFALATTHYDTTEASVRFGARVVDELAKVGLPGKHFVVDTADNGRGFPGKDYMAAFPGRAFDQAAMCKNPTQKFCAALGIPPTTDVANPRWGLPADVNSLAASDVDAYLWIDRPWLFRQSYPFRTDYAVKLAGQNPFAGSAS